MNDDLPLACTLSAGVHLGQDDATASSARPRISLLGVSAGTAAEAARALADGADYVGVGSVFGTSTKGDAGAPIGTDGLAEVVRAVGGRIPVVAIGGIGVENARACAAAGADGVAVVSAVMAAEDPEWVARRLAEEVRKGKDDFCKGRK